MKIYELLANESAWTQKSHARDISGRTCNSRSSGAVSWCLATSIGLCYSGDKGRDVLKKVMDAVGPVVDWNDMNGRTHAQVLELARKLGI